MEKKIHRQGSCKREDIKLQHWCFGGEEREYVKILPYPYILSVNYYQMLAEFLWTQRNKTEKTEDTALKQRILLPNIIIYWRVSLASKYEIHNNACLKS